MRCNHDTFLAHNRKSLQQALKKQSRSRTKAAAEDIVAYAATTHFAPDAVPVRRKRKRAHKHGNATSSKENPSHENKKHNKEGHTSIHNTHIAAGIDAAAQASKTASEGSGEESEVVSSAEEEGRSEHGKTPTQRELVLPPNVRATHNTR